MKEFLKSYKSSLILLSSIIIGGILGAVIGPSAKVVEPLGTLFINLMFMVIVPLVFFSVSSAIANMNEMKRLGKIMTSTLLVFAVTALVAAVIGVVGALIFNPTKGLDMSSFSSLMESSGESMESVQGMNILSQLVNTFTVGDFSALLSKSNMLQLIVFSVLLGVSTSLVGEKGKPLAAFLSSGSDVMMKIVDIIMHYAPIGLGCYFAALIGQLGTQILEGYLRVFLLYLALSVLYYFGFFTLYAFIAGGKQGVKSFWKHAPVPSITALATCSSAACIPVNVQYSKKMGVPEDIAETVLPLGANTHKDGSVFGGVMKIVFIFGLFGMNLDSPERILGVIAVSFLVGAVMGAIPNGGMMGEMLIISLYGLTPEILPVIAVISTIIDAPATLLNSTGNTVCSMLVARFVEKRPISSLEEEPGELKEAI
ncbi:MAG: dicarboxylate/amino acid:cation symporter [Clostridiaceae bacterium]